MRTNIHHWHAECPILVAAHPDDETIGASSCLAQFSAGRVIHLTDGAPRDVSFARHAGCESRAQYAALRRRELHEVASLVGLGPEHLECWGYVDQEVSLHMAEAARRLVALVEALGTTLILTHPYEGGHPDHDAASWVVRAACTLLQRGGRPIAQLPIVVEMTSYHWRNDTLRTACFLEGPVGEAEASVVLDAERRVLKRRMFDCYASQQEVLALFALDVERFRTAPRYDYARAPHDGPLYYETLGWPGEPWTGKRWRAEAARAQQELTL
jgi:LmbE family N-acetylglucosaminyl deacetylase